MSSDEAICKLILSWINDLLGTNLRSTDEVNDGVKLWQVLQRSWPAEFTGAPPKDDHNDRTWPTRLAVLKPMESTLNKLLAREHPGYAKLIPARPDVSKIAQGSALKDTTILLKMVFIAAYKSQEEAAWFPTSDYIQRLPQESQMIFASIVQVGADGESDSAAAPEQPGEQSSQQPGGVSKSPDDMSLENSKLVEEVNFLYGRVRRAEAETSQTRIELESTQSRLSDAEERLRKDETRIAEYQDRIHRYRTGEAGDANSEGAPGRNANLEAQISSLEDQLRQSEDERGGLQKSNESLRSKASKYQQAQDEIDELKNTMAELSRRASASEKYKEKIKRFTDLEVENRDLRRRVDELQEDISSSDATAISSSNLRRENEELRKLHEQIELHHQDEKQRNNNLAFEVQSLGRKVTNLEAENLKLQKEKEDLPQSDPLSSPRSPGQTPTATHDRSTELAAELASLKAGLDGSELSPEIASARVQHLEEELADLRMQLEDTIADEELQSLLGAVRQQNHADNLETKEQQFKLQKALAGKIENGRNASKKLQQHAIAQATLITQLQAQLAKVPRAPPPSSQPEAPASLDSRTASDLAASREENVNLVRELNLMSTAWYDLQSRLQSPNVSVSRGRIGASSEPRSWIGKQRKAVSGVLLGK
ncbi:MAG: hypothetical protein Q9227_008114 [Pyrenula ochraceoflavens]